jgi:GlpG protein
LKGPCTPDTLLLMRMIGHLGSERDAQAISDFLFVQGIDNEVEHDQENTWALWVHSEDELDRASALLREYQKSSSDPKYRQAGAEATRLKSRLEKEDRAYRKKLIQGDILRQSLGAVPYGRVSLAIIMLCGAVFFLSRFGRDMAQVQGLFITDRDSGVGVLGRLWALTEVRHGQVWRLVSPVFLHFNILHFFFNMLWLLDLGSMIEARRGKGLFIVLMLVLAVVSNLTQYLFSGPFFGGMSGVVYGLLGYAWLRGRFDPTSGLALHPHTVIMMIVWFFFCLTGLAGHVANYSHAAGLLAGMAWGYASAQLGRF